MARLSRHDSGMTNDGSAGFVEQEETSSLGFFEWTNEKHSLYLKSMEASFVNQLYSSKDLISNCSSRKLDLDVKLCRQGRRPGSGKFKVQQTGYWKENRYGNTANQLKEGDKLGTIIRNRWIKRLRAEGMPEAVPDNDAFDPCSGSHKRVLSSCGAGRDGGQSQGSSKFSEEVSDQNFADEGENRAATGQGTKRLRAMDASTSANDQVVPVGLSNPPTQDHDDGCSGSRDQMLGRDGQGPKSESAF